MNLFPYNIEEKLEVGQVREIIKGYCHTEAAAKLVNKAKPVSDFKKLQTFLSQTRECLQILNQPDNPPLQFEDISDNLTKVKTVGAYLDPEELLPVKSALSSTYHWTQFLKRHRLEYPELFQLTLGFISDIDLVKLIESTIDERGEVRSNASPELSDIRTQIIKSESKVRSSIKRILDRVKKDNYTDEKSEITIRDGRLVIPVWAEHKRHIAGFVHDESATGQTVFMEPTEVLELNNNVRELLYQEKREVQRILVNLSDKIRDRMEDFTRARSFLLLLDFICAKVRFAQEYQAVVPEVRKSPSVNLVKAFHPLLQKLNEEQGKSTIPLTLQLDHQNHRVCVISGPNAGGKSVAMKTVGLLQYLAQCGFPVTADEESSFGIFQYLFVDIGDSQSLENDLSTYSSRLQAMKYFVEFANKKTLVLIDEFGTGTEPQFGGAIAQAILQRLAKTGSYGVITTHYANIKKIADQMKGMVNAAMRYDTNKLEPLFQLEVGKPGSSFAFEIAKKIGLSEDLINDAKSLVDESHVNYDKLLTDLEGEKSLIETQKLELSSKESEVRGLKKDYEALKDMLDSERKHILKKAKIEAQAIVSEANRRIEKAVRDIKESQANKEKTRAIRKDVESYKESLSAGDKKEAGKSQGSILKKGDRVKLSGQEGVGEILSLKKNEAQVSFGNITSFVEIDKLQKVGGKGSARQKKPKRMGVDLDQRMQGFNSDLDVRGKKAEEVISLVDRFVDDALMLGANKLRILHGKGFGVLREVVRTHLNQDPNVVELQDENEDLGGSGVTIITLK